MSDKDNLHSKQDENQQLNHIRKEQKNRRQKMKYEEDLEEMAEELDEETYKAVKRLIKK